ncbi:MAG TPA: permease [Chloroflexia bacterium]|nr:permease [Chloroflexia bacterium]
MLAGHFGLAAVVKAREPQVPLWALMVSTQLLDIIFVVLYVAGIEKIVPVEGSNGGYGQLIGRNFDYTHSLVGALIISLVAMVVAAIPWGRRNGLIIGAMVFSHWVLDLLVHRPDLAILPGNAGDLPRIGLGLWAIPWLTMAMELVLILAGAYLYYHAAMRSAVKAERQEAKAGVATPGFRQQALIASVAMLVALVGTLVADVLVPFQQ